MLKNKQLTECSREKLIEGGKKIAEEKRHKQALRRAVKPNKKSEYH